MSESVSDDGGHLEPGALSLAGASVERDRHTGDQRGIVRHSSSLIGPSGFSTVIL
jgi:hypothetical protein